MDVSRYQVVRVGDLVVNKMKAWQGSVAISAFEGIVSPDYLVCSVDRGINSQFLHYLLRSQLLINEFRLRSKGIRPSQWRLYWEDLADISVTLPPSYTQRRIADFLDIQTRRIDAIQRARARQISALKEREVAAILAVLSGADERGDRQITNLPWMPEIPQTWRIAPVYSAYDVQLTRERRQALITAAVTRKLDVSTVRR